MLRVTPPSVEGSTEGSPSICTLADDAVVGVGRDRRRSGRGAVSR
jgi:hypothetical protein